MKLKSIALSLLIVVTVFAMSACGGSKFQDFELDVPVIEVTTSSVNTDGYLSPACAANRDPNDPRGENYSPQLSWSSTADIAFYAVIIYDTTASWLHMFKLDIDTGLTSLTEGAYTSETVYVGPYPPKGSGVHSYRLEILALKSAAENLSIQNDSQQDYKAMLKAINDSGDGNNIAARGNVTVKYKN